MSYVKITRPRHAVAQVTLDRPERMNAMAFDVMVPLREALEELSFDNSVRVVILTGAGEAFCSGADLVDPGYLSIFDGLTMSGIARRALRVMDDVVRTMRDMHQPVIAAINGAAIGGGFCLAMAADIRIAAEQAYFRAAGINNGLTAAELGLSFTLPRAIGSTRAFDIMLSGRDVDSEEAERIGIVGQRCTREDLLERCYAYAERLIGLSHLGVELTKQLLWAGLEASSMQSHINHEGHAQLFVRMTTRNFEEAITARKEKRKPVFKD